MTDVDSYYCRGCRYELSGISPDDDGLAQCPECGRTFAPDDVGTVSSSPHHPVTRLVFNRFAAYILLGLVVGFSWIETWLPRPAVDASGSFSFDLWVWFDRPYGVERVDMRGGDPWAREVRVRWWGGRVTSASMWGGEEEAAVRHWHLARADRDDDNWSLMIDDPSVSTWRDIVFYFNSMRSDSELFGVRIGEDAEASSSDSVEISGTQVDVMGLLVRVYDLEIQPVEPLGRDWVWTWNASLSALERVETSRVEGLLPAQEGGPVSRHQW